MPGTDTSTSRHRSPVTFVVVGLVLLVGVVGLVVWAWPLTGPGTGDRDRATRAEVAEVLRERADAVLDRDRDGYLRRIDPGQRAFRAEQERRFGNLREVPLAAYRYRVVRAEPADDGRILVDAELSYRLRRYDTRPVTATEEFAFSRRDGRLWIAADRGGVAQLWDYGPVHAARGEHALVLGLGDREALADRAAEADRAVAAVREAWPGEWSGTVVLEVPATLRQMAGLLDAPESTYRSIAAVTTAGPRGGGADAADRVIVNPEAFDDLTAFGRRSVLVHETTHVATRRATTATTPMWLSEGFADWVAYRSSDRGPTTIAPELHRELRAGRTPAALPDDAAFAPDAPGLATAYQMAWLACRMVADEDGDDRLVALYRASGDSATRVRRTLDTDLTAFTARWRDYLHRELP